MKEKFTPVLMPSLVDKKVCGFYEWREELEKEDVREIGSIVNRSPAVLHALYDAYVKFQNSDTVVAGRKYYYGE